MRNIPFVAYTCPIDGISLSEKDNSFRCDNGHNFDRAKNGYINLLPVQHKRSRFPGDSKEMVMARKAFLNTNKYQELVEQLYVLIKQLVLNKSHFNFLDAGCGEGYYSDYLFSLFDGDKSPITFSMIGLDISKFAIFEAAKRNKNISWLVATNRTPPLSSQCIDIILCVFGFYSFSGFDKVLTKDGSILLVEPGPNHLIELREIIYDKVTQDKPNLYTEAEKYNFKQGFSKQVAFKIHQLTREHLELLLLMTPHFFRINEEGRKNLSNIEAIDISVDFNIIVFNKLK